jgi:hypothetical protein
MASETPLSEVRCDVALSDVAALLGALHACGAPIVGDGVVSLADRVEFIFEHWVQRHRRRGETVTGAVQVMGVLGDG